jgi:hypothetical protein
MNCKITKFIFSAIYYTSLLRKSRLVIKVQIFLRRVFAEKYFILNRHLTSNGTEPWFSGCEVFHADELSVMRMCHILSTYYTAG